MRDIHGILHGCAAPRKPDLTFGEERAFELAAIRSSLANLRTFPFIQEAEKVGLLGLHGLHFELASGRVIVLDETSGRFEALDAP